MNAPRRDPVRERRFLHAAAPLTREWVDHACRRLEAGEQEYAGSWATRGLCELLNELAEEAADIGAWAVLAEQALDQRDDLEGCEREALHTDLLDAARKGARAWARVAHARDLLETIDRDHAR